VATVGDHVTVPVYCAFPASVVTGVAPATGAVTPGIAATFITVAVAGNTADTLPVLTAFVAVAPATVKKFTATPVKVNPAVGVRVIVAV
jgi:hypothetical protein